MKRFIVDLDKTTKFSKDLIDYMVIIMKTPNPEKIPLEQLIKDNLIDQMFAKFLENSIPDWATHFVQADEINFDEAPNPYNWELIPK